MKKLICIFSFILFTLISLNLKVTANSGEEILYKYNSTTPVTYYNTNDPVYIPTEITYHKQEFRGVWVATIWNLDIPKQTSIEQYKTNFLDILNVLEQYNMNVLVFQVRPKNDAFYPSELNPWSRFLTGIEGKDPGWDPLEWMIEETHKRGIEFHAWFNPYRVFKNELSPDNFAAKHPNYVLNLAPGEEIFNPGIPEVQQFIIDTVVEVAENYKIDGVHFDDYFYPYGGLAPSYDSTQFQQYNPNKLSLDNWRRENVNHVIKTIKSELTRINTEQNKAIQLGMSPFGIWANKSNNPLGSNTRGGVESYSELYADSYRWVKEQWIDYIVPQVYFEFTEANAPYADIVDWWANLVKGTNVNLYTGHSIYRYKEKGWNTGPWTNPDELLNQLLYNSKYIEVTGSVQFRLYYLKNIGPSNLTYAQNQLRDNYFKYKVLPPASRNVDNTSPNAPSQLAIQRTTEGNQLTWQKGMDAKAYYVYRYNENEVGTLHDIKHVIDIVWPTDSETVSYVDKTAEDGVTYKYFITAFSKANIEGTGVGINTNAQQETPTEDFVVKIVNKISQVNTKLSTYHILFDDIQTKSTSINQLMELNNKINTDLEKMKQDIELYQNQLIEINDQQFTNLKDLIVKLENDLQLGIETYDVYNTQLNEINVLKSDIVNKLNNIQTQYNEVTTLLEQITTDITSFKTQYREVSKIKDLSTNLLEDQFDDMSDLITILNQEKNNLTSSYQIVINQINELNDNQVINEGLLDQLDSSVRTSILNLNKFPSISSSLDSKKQYYDSFYTDFTTKYTELSNEKDGLDAKIEQLTSQIKALEPTKEEPKSDGFNPIFIGVGAAVVIIGAVAFISLKKRS